MAKGKQVRQEGHVSAGKQPKAGKSADSYLNRPPLWSFAKMDCAYEKWGLNHTEDLFTEVIEKLHSFEGMTWGEIIQASGGRKYGTNHHFDNVSELIPEAQRRWGKLGYEEYDQVFSLRLDATRRLFGILLDGVFSVVWYDQRHEIYKMKK